MAQSHEDKLIRGTIASIWDTIDKLLVTAADKDKHVRGLFKNRQLPMMSEDTPIRTWACINEYLRTIAHLEDVLRRAELARRRKKPAPGGTSSSARELPAPPRTKASPKSGKTRTARG